jgi:agmatine/peptidylarginine deiminase
MRTAFLLLAGSLMCGFRAEPIMAQYSMPSEEHPHEGTWLQWPHNYTYGSGAEDLEISWVAMTAALTEGERVHIIAYNEGEISHITLRRERIPEISSVIYQNETAPKDGRPLLNSWICVLL